MRRPRVLAGIFILGLVMGGLTGFMRPWADTNDADGIGASAPQKALARGNCAATQD